MFVVAFYLLNSSSNAAISTDGIWHDLAYLTATQDVSHRKLYANMDTLSQRLLNSNAFSDQELCLPLPDNEHYTCVTICEAPVIAPALAQRYPHIKTFRICGGDANIQGRIGLTPRGFHAYLTINQQTVIIEPEAHFNSTASKNIYRSFKKSAQPTLDHQQCHIQATDKIVSPSTTGLSAKTSGAQLRTYRIAIATTGEYTAAVSSGSPSKVDALASIVAGLNYLNQIFEREVAVNFVLIANNEDIIYTNGDTDPYSSGDIFSLLDENQSNLDNVIGTANYDIGHIFDIGNGGLAVLRGSCIQGLKAQGVSSSFNPASQSFVVSLWAHEIGHQLGANHSFNATSSSCGGLNRHAPTAWEVGAGSTIMSYAGICPPQNLQSTNDDYFHAGSIEEMRAFLDDPSGGSACGTVTATNNTPPTVLAGSLYTVPAQTPFVLTASGTDLDPGDIVTLTYNWEQIDTGTASNSVLAMHTDDGSRPLFRSFPPTPSASRYFPKLSAIVSGNLNGSFGERLPTTDRSMAFSVTARSGNYGVNQDKTTLTVSADAGPFEVTTPPTNAQLNGFDQTTVNWSVANTDQAPIHCSHVNIDLSTDGGTTFNQTLLAETPNNGVANVNMANVSTTTARLRVMCANNIFFALSPGNFRITSRTEGISVITDEVSDRLEGNSGSTYFNLRIVRIGSTSGTASVDYAVSGTGAMPANNQDFSGGILPMGTLTFANGESERQFAIGVQGDTEMETNESFTFQLSNPVNTTLGNAWLSGTIVNDDHPTAIGFSSDALQLDEGDTGFTQFTYQVERTSPLDTPSSVNYTVAPYGENPATADDFAEAIFPTGTLYFETGVSQQTIAVAVATDTTAEDDEQFTITLNAPVNAILAKNQIIETIVNDDALPSIGFADDQRIIQDEGDSGATLFSFLLTRNGSFSNTHSSVQYTVFSGNASTDATASDFTNNTLPSGTLEFTADTDQQTLEIRVNGDKDIEPNEQFIITLHTPDNAYIINGNATGIIRNDDSENTRVGGGGSSTHLGLWGLLLLLRQRLRIFQYIKTRIPS